MGDTPLLQREKDTWEHGTICYVGRLERRKGITEWLEAAVSVAADDPTVNFEFIGTNCLGTNRMTGEEFLELMVPKDMRVRFHFQGEQKRSYLPRFLSAARIAVVPSRWENFPNTCVEAMCSGLPVIASPNGGMTEMIKDGQTGWLSRDQTGEGLAEALKRALETPPARIKQMGLDASSHIRNMCDNQKIVESHIDLRKQIVNKGPKRSLLLPANLPWAKMPLADESPRRTPKNSQQKGVAIVVTCFNAGHLLDDCLQSIKQQTSEPKIVVVVDCGSTEKQTLKALNQAMWEGVQVIQRRNEGRALAKNAGIDAVKGLGLNPLAFVFLDADDRLHPHFVETCESVLEHSPEVGIVSCWVHNLETDDKLWIRPCPSFPYQWLSNDLVPFSAVRNEALLEVGNFRSEMSEGYEDWDLFNAVMAAGWVAVTIPETLGHHRFSEDSIANLGNSNGNGRMRRELLERFPDLITRDAKEIVLLTESHAAYLVRDELYSLQDQLARAKMMLRRPGETALRVLTRMKKKIFPNPL
jgi:glycosyltransferase involved in cell wall biosynthesis